MEPGESEQSSGRHGVGNLAHYTVAMIDAPQNEDPTHSEERNKLLIQMAERQKKMQAKGFQFGGYVSQSSSDHSSYQALSSTSSSPATQFVSNHLLQQTIKENRVSEEMAFQQPAEQPALQTVRSNEMLPSSSPDSVREAFLNQSNQALQPMQLTNKRLSAPEDESATFGKHYQPKYSSQKMKRVLEGAIKGSVCQVRRNCKNPAIDTCNEKHGRGCTLGFCEEHSGFLNRQRNELFCCRPCSSDKHEDICQECSQDILGMRFKFYVCTVILSLLIFSVLVCLIHLVLQSFPSLCRNSASEASFCGAFQRTIHSLNPYTQSPQLNMQKANTALHMFSQTETLSFVPPSDHPHSPDHHNI